MHNMNKKTVRKKDSTAVFFSPPQIAIFSHARDVRAHDLVTYSAMLTPAPHATCKARLQHGPRNTLPVCQGLRGPIG